MPYIGQQPTNVAFLTDQFSGNGSSTAFTLSAAPATTSSILVAISGVLQDPSTYSVSGTTLTFSPAPPTGTGNISVRFLGIPASNITTTAYRTVTEFTATAGQTTFSVPSYTVGFIDVYRNGVLLGSADYTATSGLSVVLAIGCTVGDLVEVISFSVSSVLNAIPATTGSVGTTFLADNSVTTAKILDLNVTTAKINNAAVTPAKLSQPLTSDTAKASTSGTSVEFTGIPSWVRRITVMFNGVSTNGSSIIQIQVGSTTYSTSGYASTASFGASAGQFTAATTGFITDPTSAAAATVLRSGFYQLTLINSNTWVGSGNFGTGAGGQVTNACAGASPNLAAALDRIRVTTVNGTDTFDAGTINILYE
jgi:hypothetical protein